MTNTGTPALTAAVKTVLNDYRAATPVGTASDGALLISLRGELDRGDIDGLVRTGQINDATGEAYRLVLAAAAADLVGAWRFDPRDAEIMIEPGQG